MTLQIDVDDLSSEDTRALVATHLAGMLAATPPESVHALGAAELQHPDVTVWAARVDGDLAGIAALKALDAHRGEIKSMRVVDAFLGRGIGRALVRHLVAAARARGMTSVWLETGSAAEFAPARALYASEGFVECAPFEPYAPDPLSTFMTRRL
ncbi:GNAT family N-acetyltransferase [Microbacterium sp. RD1]|uniref:GNAT family N-acetyltransferase n=1 Tax=Microbacterium sp. RD1 TaxID=3457313 RepID=UPI003FA5D3E5